MISEERVRVMTKMSIYEKGSGAKDLSISNYYKNDYSSMNALITAIWITIGYAILIGLLAFCFLDTWIEDLSMDKMIFLAVAVVVMYLIILIAYVIGARIFYNRKHVAARKRMKQYYRDLSRLGKIYKKESRS